MGAISDLHKLGQSLWYDNIERRLLENGELAHMIKAGEIRGITSNPSIFNNAISKSNDYDTALKTMAWAGWDSEQIFTRLAVEDICKAADLFLPLYQSSQGADGYVSLEVNPRLANNTQATISEARRLWEIVNRPNLMIKIPATAEGIPAIRAGIAEGMNINVTLIFSLDRYKEVINAYLDGLEERVNSGKSIDSIASVASFFISRLDTKIDAQLADRSNKDAGVAKQASSLQGKAAIAYARLAYQIFREYFTAPRFKALQKKGANLQRPLWASTSTKNPAYSDVLYVEELIGPHTVNTVPSQTLTAFRDHGVARLTIESKDPDPHQIIQQIESLGISIGKATRELEVEGVKTFADAFTSLLASIEGRRKSAVDGLLPLNHISARIQALKKGDFVNRMLEKDASLWTEDKTGQEEIAIRLGWLNAPVVSRSLLDELNQLVNECQQEGIKQVLLLGMGGSSLAPEVMAMTFGLREVNGALGLPLTVLDSTDPEQVRAAARTSPVDTTLFIVSSKSGSTSEVDALFRFFYKKARRRLGTQAGRHFVAVTDPGTSLEKKAAELGFRQVILADPFVGGRYSALTAFGLTPASLLGIDLPLLLDRAGWMMDQCRPEIPYERNPGIVLGAILGEAALQGKNKLTFIADPEFASFGSWLEQLIAESSGKNGKGIIPVDIEPVMDKSVYGKDRIFVYFEGSGKNSQKIRNIQNAGHPILSFTFRDEYELASEFYRWEFATAVACSILNVNAFDQPDVQDSKTRTLQKISYFKANGKLESSIPAWENDSAEVFIYPTSPISKNLSLKEIFGQFLDGADEGNYLAVNAYLPRNTRTIARLQKIRARIQKRTNKATTLGFGPRFLHSTGQLHKGGPNIGRFIQITSSHKADLPIPGDSLTFETLQFAQAQGDLEALVGRNRKVLRIHLKNGDLHNLLENF